MIAVHVVEALVAREIESFPDRSLGGLAVPDDDPYLERGLQESLAGERDADADRQSLTERTRRDVDPGKDGRGVTLESRAELAEREELGVVDRARGAEHRVHERRRMTFGEDQVIAREQVRTLEVVAKMTREQHRHQIGGGKRRRGVTRPGRRRTTDAVGAQLTRQGAIQIEARRGRAHGRHDPTVPQEEPLERISSVAPRG